jgi:GR25 family glycosyltransferase involved in LPS biosynthesis
LERVIVLDCQVVFISLPRHPDRRAPLRAELRRLGLHHATWFPAADGAAHGLMDDVLVKTRLLHPDALRQTSKGQRGCLASHAAVWQQAAWRAPGSRCASAG